MKANKILQAENVVQSSEDGYETSEERISHVNLFHKLSDEEYKLIFLQVPSDHVYSLTTQS